MKSCSILSYGLHLQHVGQAEDGGINARSNASKKAMAPPPAAKPDVPDGGGNVTEPPRSDGSDSDESDDSM